MEITKTLLINAACLLIPPVVVVLLLRHFFPRKIRWSAGVVALVAVSYTHLGTFVIFVGFQIARLMQGWRDRIPYRTGGFEYGYKLHH